MRSHGTLAALWADLARALRDRRWCLIGAQAAILYGSTRATADVDVSLSVDDRERNAVLGELVAFGFEPRIDEPLAFAARTRVLLLRHAPTGVPLDVVFAGPGPEQLFLDRARAREVAPGVRLPVISVEDLIASKLLAGRAHDVQDVAHILRRAGPIDTAQVEALLREFERALDRSDLGDTFRRLHGDR
jgi:hypothetical protein